MKKLLLLFIVAGAVSQEKSEVTGCDSELIERSKEEGMRSIRYSEYPAFLLELWKCFGSDERNETFKKINETTYQSDLDNSKKLNSFTSSCAYCASTAVVIFYIFKLTGN